MYIFVNKLKYKEMKKITLSLVALLTITVGFSQTSLVEVYGPSEPTFNSQNELMMGPCSSEVPSNASENGLFFGGAQNQFLAVDVDVAPDDEFIVEVITINVVDMATTITINFMEDVAGLPGNVLFTLEETTDFDITDEVIVGNNFGFDFYQYTIELITTVQLDGGVAGSKYWMEVISDAAAWEATTEESTFAGLPLAFNNDNTAGVWTISPTTELVYSISGECTALSLNDNLASQVAIYPTPAVDVINIKIPSSMEINEVVLYDLQGRNTGAVFTDGTVNVSGLSRGVYMLNVKTSEGTLTQKVVKK